MSKKLVEFIVEFGYTAETSGWGNPDENVLVMNDDMSVVPGEPLKDRMDFWNEQMVFWREYEQKDEL